MRRRDFRSTITPGREVLVLLAGAGMLLLAGCATEPAPEPRPEVIVLIDDGTREGQVDFDTGIAPWMEAKCVSCHHDHGQLTALSFQRRDGMLEENAERPVLVPGDPEKSTLFLVTVMPEYFVEAMPPSGHRLSEDEVTSLYWWIRQGAPWPKGRELQPGAGLEE